MEIADLLDRLTDGAAIDQQLGVSRRRPPRPIIAESLRSVQTGSQSSP